MSGLNYFPKSNLQGLDVRKADGTYQKASALPMDALRLASERTNGDSIERGGKRPRMGQYVHTPLPRRPSSTTSAFSRP